MNRNDFYKELMTQYALDPEKIRLNALKQAKQPVWQKAVSTYWKPAVGAAAAVAVTVAGVALTTQSSAPDIRIAPEEALSASQRLIEAEQEYYKLQNPEENARCNMYVTFMEAVSYSDVVMSLSGVDDSGEIELCALYLSNGDVFRGDEINSFVANHGDETAVVAAKINLPSIYYRDIQDLYIVYLAEIGSDEINDDTFTPIEVEDGDPLESDHLSITTTATEAPVVTTTPFVYETTVNTTKQPVIGESADENTTVPPITEDIESSELTSSVTSEPEIFVEETSETTVTTLPPASDIAPAETTTTYYRGNIGLMTEVYELNIQNSLETRIFGCNAVVLTKNNVYLFTLSGLNNARASQEISLLNSKFVYSDENTVILTGCGADGLRDTLAVIDLSSSTITTYDASANIGGGELGAVHYSNAYGKYFVKAITGNSTLIYEVAINGGVDFRPLFEIEAPVSLTGYSDNALYFIVNESAASTKLCRFNYADGTAIELASFGGSVKIKRGVDFSSFAISDESLRFILDVNTNMLVPAEYSDDVTLVCDGGETFFRTNGSVYKITSASAVVEADRAVAFEKAVSDEFVVNEINSEKVVVIRKDDNLW